MTADPADAVCEARPVDALFSEVYQQLRRLAHRQRRAGDGATLNTTALVHELYLRVSTNSGLAFAQPAQFFAYAARARRTGTSRRWPTIAPRCPCAKRSCRTSTLCW